MQRDGTVFESLGVLKWFWKHAHIQKQKKTRSYRHSLNSCQYWASLQRLLQWAWLRGVSSFKISVSFYWELKNSAGKQSRSIVIIRQCFSTCDYSLHTVLQILWVLLNQTANLISVVQQKAIANIKFAQWICYCNRN